MRSKIRFVDLNKPSLDNVLSSQWRPIKENLEKLVVRNGDENGAKS